MKNLLAIVLLSSLTASSVAHANGIEDLDGDTTTKTKKAKKKKDVRAGLEGEVIREIERGYFFKSEIGGNAYLLNYGILGAGVLDPGIALAIGGGNDFVDNEHNSLSWELNFVQAEHQGMSYSQQIQNAVDPRYRLQGDTRTFAAIGDIEYSVYPTRRIGIGVRGGAGVMMAPLLMTQDAWQRDVVTPAGGEPGVHKSPHPLVEIGPTFEYYTKLSHFSVGADITFSYALGFDAGASGGAYLKYTY